MVFTIPLNKKEADEVDKCVEDAMEWYEKDLEGAKTMVKKVKYNWADFDKHVVSILAEIKKRKWNITAVYAIPKGGLPLGVTLANHLNVPLYLDAYKTRHLRGQILLVDDISDSGRTLIEFPNVCDFRTVTLYIKAGTHFIPHYYCRTASKDEWIVFPWESINNKTERTGTVNKK